MNKTPEQMNASLIVFVGRLLAVCFTFTVMAFIYGVLFVDQPLEQAPTDAQLIDLLSTLLVFLTGTLSGLVASNGLKSKSAVDLSYRYMADKNKGVPTGRKTSLEFINKVVANANALGVQCILDYFPKPFGRGWRCDRQAWSSYSKPEISSAPGGDWWHVEISPTMADNPQAVEAAFLLVFGDNPPTA
jgi:hypothetical protein